MDFRPKLKVASHRNKDHSQNDTDCGAFPRFRVFTQLGVAEETQLGVVKETGAQLRVVKEISTRNPRIISEWALSRCVIIEVFFWPFQDCIPDCIV